MRERKAETGGTPEACGRKQKISVQLLSSPSPEREKRREEGDIIVGKIEKYQIGAEMLHEGAQRVNVTTN